MHAHVTSTSQLINQPTLIEILDDVGDVCDDEGEDGGTAAQDEDVDDSLFVVDRHNVAVAHRTKG